MVPGTFSAQPKLPPPLVQVAAIGGGSPRAKWAALSAAVLELAPLVSCFSVACNSLHGYEPDIRALLAAHGHPEVLVAMGGNRANLEYTKRRLHDL